MRTREWSVRPLGLGDSLPDAPLTVDSPIEQRLAYCAAAECGDRQHELPCGKVGFIAPQLLKDARSVGIDRMPSQRVSTGTRCPEVLKVRPRTLGDSEAFRGRGTTNVSGADEQYVQR